MTVYRSSPKGCHLLKREIDGKEEGREVRMGFLAARPSSRGKGPHSPRSETIGVNRDGGSPSLTTFLNVKRKSVLCELTARGDTSHTGEKNLPPNFVCSVKFHLCVDREKGQERCGTIVCSVSPTLLFSTLSLK